LDQESVENYIFSCPNYNIHSLFKTLEFSSKFPNFSKLGTNLVKWREAFDSCSEITCSQQQFNGLDQFDILFFIFPALRLKHNGN
jgi:hypothetical protein